MSLTLLWVSFHLLSASLVERQPQTAVAPTGTIAGTIVAIDGAPAAGVFVYAVKEDEARSNSHLATTDEDDARSISHLATTDWDGRFILANVLPGRYYVGAGDLKGKAGRSVYYPGSVDKDRASVLTVAGGRTLVDIDFPLVWPVVERVRGLIKRDPRDAAANPPNVTLNSGLQSFKTVAAEDGSFEFRNVPPGVYTAWATAERHSPQSRTVTIEEGWTGEIEFDFPWRITVCGRAVLENGGPLPDFQLTFTGEDGVNHTVQASTTSVNAGECDGIASGPGIRVFSVNLPEGEHRVKTTGLSSAYLVKSMNYGVVDLLRETAKIEEPVTQEIRVTLALSSAPVKVSGSVTGYPSTNPLMKSAVVKMSAIGLPTLSTPVQPDGSFEFVGVPPGSYSAVVMTDCSILGNAAQRAAIWSCSVQSSSRFALPMNIDVADQDIAGIRIGAPRFVKGRITVAPAGAIPTAQIGFTASIPDPDRAGRANSELIMPEVSPDGTFQLLLPEGEYRVTVSNTSQVYRLLSITSGSLELGGAPLVVTATEPDEVLVAFERIMTSAAFRVSGRVIPPPKVNPLNPAKVTLPYGPASESAIIASDGSFEFVGLPPGKYFALVTPGSAGVSFSLTDRDMAGLEIVVHRQINITGIVETVAGVAPAMMSGLAVEATNVGAMASARVMPDGTFKFTVESENDYSIALSGIPPGYVLRAVAWGPVDLMGAPLALRGADLPAAIEIRITLDVANGVREPR